MVNEDVRDLIEAELMPDEELLWADKPSALPITVLDVVTILIYLIMAIAIYDVDVPKLSQGIDYFYMFVKFIPYYCAFMCLRVVLRVLLRKRHVYAITSKRVLLKSYIFKRSFKYIEDFRRVQCEKNAIGTITFVPHGYSDGDVLTTNMEDVGLLNNGLFPWYDRQRLDKFYNVQNPSFVADLIRELFLQPIKNENPGFQSSRRARRRRRSI